MPPYGYWPFQTPPPPQDQGPDYESMIRGLPAATTPTDPRQMGLMRFMQPGPFYGPSQGIAGPVPRGTPMSMPGGSVAQPQSPYDFAMSGQQPSNQQPEPYGPPQAAVRLPDQGGPPGMNYQGMVDDYLRSLTQPYHLPEPTPYSKREKLGLLAAREPWQRDVIMSAHREPYERAMAEAQIGERRRSGAATIASNMEKAQAYERARLTKAPSQALDYVDKVEKAQADVGNTDYPYTKPQWKALADFKSQSAPGKMASTKEKAIEDIDREIQTDEGRFLQATSDPLRGFMPETDLEGGRKAIVGDIQARRAALQGRRSAIAGMTPDIYRKFRNLTADQQEEVIRAYQKRATVQPEGQGPGPVAPAPSYYP